MYSLLLALLLVAADEPLRPLLTYDESGPEGIRRNVPVVVYVGIEPVRAATDDYIVTRAKSLEGYPEKCVAVFKPDNGVMYWEKTYREDEPVRITPVGYETGKPMQANAMSAMDEVNAKRARKGLRPLIEDPALTAAALRCAQQRAARNIHGHLPESDFSYLQGGHATAAGCGALEPSWGWETCCYDDPRYSVGGAAWVPGPGGRRFMHIFCR